MLKLTRLSYNSNEPYATRTIEELRITNTTLVLVPDEETLHEVQGLALIVGKKLIVRVLEPGREFPWEINMLSPWHVNTDKYTLTFGTSSTFQSPHLVYAPSYLTAYK